MLMPLALVPAGILRITEMLTQTANRITTHYQHPFQHTFPGPIDPGSLPFSFAKVRLPCIANQHRAGTMGV
jgi:hypothetical protein